MILVRFEIQSAAGWLLAIKEKQNPSLWWVIRTLYNIRKGARTCKKDTGQS
mgnify:CR=1 FL=1